MSLINDALRRSSQGGLRDEVGGVPPPLEPLIPALPDDSEAPKSKAWVMLVVALLLIGGAGAAGVYLWKHGQLDAITARFQKVKATSSPVLLVQAKSRAAATAQQIASKRDEYLGEINKVVVLSNALPASSSDAAKASPAHSAAPAIASPAPSAPRVPPPPATPVNFPNLRLQGIYYRPPNPSVMISGRTLYLKDQIQGMTIAAIDPTSVTLVLSGQTNILTLR